MSSAADTTGSRRDAQKMTDQPANMTAVPNQIEPSSDDLIRKMIVAEKRENNRAALPDLAPAHQSSGDQPDPRCEPIKHPRKKFGITKTQSATQGPQSPKSGKRALSGGTGQWIAVVLGGIRTYRPTFKHTVFALIAVVFFLSPWLIPVTLFITFWVMLIAYLTLGPDRVAELVVAGWRALHKRRPALAEVIRQRAEETALRVDGFLDRMPAKWRDGLHVPDFSADQEGADEFPDPFERLTKEAPQS